VSHGFRDLGILRSLPFEPADDGGRVLEQNAHPGQAVGALSGTENVLDGSAEGTAF